MTRLLRTSVVAVVELALAISLVTVPDAASATHKPRSRSTLPSSTRASPGSVCRRGSGRPRR